MISKSEKSEKLFECIGQIDDRFIMENQPSQKKKSNIRPIFMTLGGVCAAAVAGTILLYMGRLHMDERHNSSYGDSAYIGNPERFTDFYIDYEKLPFTYSAGGELQPIATTGLANDGMGYPGFSAYDVSEGVGNNPWNEDLMIAELPVFRSNCFQNAVYPEDYLPKLQEIAAGIGEELTDVQYTVYDREDLQAALGPEAATIDALAGRTEKITARAGDAVLQVLGGSGIEIIFTQSESILPDSGQLNYYDAEAYAEEHRYLAEKYLGILGFDDYKLSMSGSYGQDEAGAAFEAFVYDGADNAFDAILNYNFKTAVFYVKGSSVRITLGDTPDMLECMGFYPVITAQEARSMLLEDYEKKDKSDVFPEQLSEENIAYVELVYRETNGTLYGETAGAGYYLPYYQFMIRLDDAQEGALHRYGILYIPAVAPEYIEGVDAAVKFN